MRNISPPWFLKQPKDASFILTMWVLGRLIAVLENVRVRIALSLSHGFQKFKWDDEFLPCVGQCPFLFYESLCEYFCLEFTLCQRNFLRGGCNQCKVTPVLLDRIGCGEDFCLQRLCALSKLLRYPMIVR